MIFVTHYAFRRAHLHSRAPLRFRMAGYPATTLLGAALMATVLLTTALTVAFRLTLVFGLSFLAVLTAVYCLWYRGSIRTDCAAARQHGSAARTALTCRDRRSKL
jgi:L-asparagine transporter-like permease